MTSSHVVLHQKRRRWAPQSFPYTKIVSSKTNQMLVNVLGFGFFYNVSKKYLRDFFKLLNDGIGDSVLPITIPRLFGSVPGLLLYLLGSILMTWNKNGFNIVLSLPFFPAHFCSLREPTRRIFFISTVIDKSNSLLCSCYNGKYYSELNIGAWRHHRGKVRKW